MDRRERPWKKLRVVVEVTVPPTNRSTEKDLMYQISQSLSHSLSMPRMGYPGSYPAVVRLKTFTAFYPAFRRAEKGIVNTRRNRQKPVLVEPDSGL